jgi:hypothetical protein
MLTIEGLIATRTFSAFRAWDGASTSGGLDGIEVFRQVKGDPCQPRLYSGGILGKIFITPRRCL